LDADEVNILLECYQTLYPRDEIELVSCVARKYTSVVLGTEKFGSKMDCHNLRSARIMASWTDEDGSIDTTAPRRPGIVNSYILHSVKLNGKLHQHAFPIVWWYTTDLDHGHFGKPAEVWRHDHEPCGPSLFMPIQRIAQKFACSSVKVNGVDKIVVNPIPRSFH